MAEQEGLDVPPPLTEPPTGEKLPASTKTNLSDDGLPTDYDELVRQYNAARVDVHADELLARMLQMSERSVAPARQSRLSRDDVEDLNAMISEASAAIESVESEVRELKTEQEVLSEKIDSIASDIAEIKESILLLIGNLDDRLPNKDSAQQGSPPAALPIGNIRQILLFQTLLQVVQMLQTYDVSSQQLRRAMDSAFGR